MFNLKQTNPGRLDAQVAERGFFSQLALGFFRLFVSIVKCNLLIYSECSPKVYGYVLQLGEFWTLITLKYTDQVYILPYSEY